jgi:hypothetical protein
VKIYMQIFFYIFFKKKIVFFLGKGSICTEIKSAFPEVSCAKNLFWILNKLSG